MSNMCVSVATTCFVISLLWHIAFVKLTVKHVFTQVPLFVLATAISECVFDLVLDGSGMQRRFSLQLQRLVEHFFDFWHLLFVLGIFFFQLFHFRSSYFHNLLDLIALLSAHAFRFESLKLALQVLLVPNLLLVVFFFLELKFALFDGAI